MHMVIRTGLPPSSLAQSAKEAIWAIAPSIPVTRVRPMVDIVEGSISGTCVTSTLFAVFGALSLLLGCIGVYGVVAHALGQRRREFGVRIALGASSSSVARGALRGAGVTVVLGLLAGVTATPFVGSVLAASVQGAHSRAPGVLVTASVVLAAVALTAAWYPRGAPPRSTPWSPCARTSSPPTTPSPTLPCHYCAARERSRAHPRSSPRVALRPP